MASYKHLNELPPDAFLNPDNFITEYDSLPRMASNMCRADYAKQQYETGLAWGKKCRYIAIGAGGTWSGATNDGGHVTSYEGIGYHANTAELLRGFLDSGVTIVVYRYTPDGISETFIQGGATHTIQNSIIRLGGN